MNIDVDSHFTPYYLVENFPKDLTEARLERDAKGNPEIFYQKLNSRRKIAEQHYSIKIRTQAMKEAFFDKACLLQNNGIFCEQYCSPETARALARVWNDGVANVMEKDERFIGIAQTSHLNLNDAMEEAERAVKDLDFKAIEVHGRWGSDNFESPKWWPFFELVERLDVPLWFHSLGVAAGRPNPWQPAHEETGKMPPGLGALLGFLIHPQIVTAGMIFSGIFDKFPNLKMGMTECEAGWVPGFMGWLDFEYETYLVYKQAGILGIWDFGQPIKDVRLRKKPSEYVRENFYFTLASSSDYCIETLLPLLIDVFHFEDRLMIESDYDHPEGSLDIVSRIRNSTKISDEAKDRICGRNAAELLKIDWAPSSYAEAFAR